MTMTGIAQLTIGTVDLAAAFLFMYGLKRMSSPVTAPSGIFVAGIGMLAAVLASFLYVFDVSAAARSHLTSLLYRRRQALCRPWLGAYDRPLRKQPCSPLNSSLSL